MNRVSKTMWHILDKEGYLIEDLQWEGPDSVIEFIGTRIRHTKAKFVDYFATKLKLAPSIVPSPRPH
jgi:hypothetical protein